MMQKEKHTCTGARISIAGFTKEEMEIVSVNSHGAYYHHL